MDRDENILLELHAIEAEIYWRAVLERDARFNGIFVYGVRSTGIYCKPACPSRRPGREQVAFYASPEEAERKHLRACLRCRPRAETMRDPRVEMALRVCRVIEGQREGAPSLIELGEELKLSPHHLQRTFKSVTGITPRQYAAAHRLKQFKAGIKEGEDVTTAMYDAGFGSSSRLYEKSSQHLGMTPATYRRRGKGMKINYTIVDCHLGRMLVAGTTRGVCSVQFGAEDEALEAALVAEYPEANVKRDESGLNDWIEELLKHLDGAQPDLALPLDLQATVFQTKVWEELRRIPYGATRSYSGVAQAINQPTATRAVARACATNPVALVTPCHRVVREGGHLGGYRWGLERKEELLKLERNRAAASDAVKNAEYDQRR
jgi:AraC family transcriptional regulator of adaptative response/methylated-DNA-[protein]-cysteine methyltransferase